MRSASALGSRSVSVRRHEPPLDEPGRERDLADEAVAPLGPCERGVDERTERAAQCQLVADRLGELERLRNSAGGRRPRTRAAAPPLARPQARRPSGPNRSATAPPGSPASCPSFAPERFQLVVALPLERQQRERQRREEPPHLLVARRRAAARPRDGRSCERGEAPAGGADARVPLRSRPRRAHAAAPARGRRRAAPRHASRSTRRPSAAGLDREARVLERSGRSPPTRCSAAAGSGSTSTSRGHVASASPSRIRGRTPAASAAAVTGPSSGSPPGSGERAAGRSASDGVSRSAAFSSNPGMERQAITGTYVLHEHLFSCQAGTATRPRAAKAPALPRGRRCRSSRRMPRSRPRKRSTGRQGTCEVAELHRGCAQRHRAGAKLRKVQRGRKRSRAGPPSGCEGGRREERRAGDE